MVGDTLWPRPIQNIFTNRQYNDCGNAVAKSQLHYNYIQLLSLVYTVATLATCDCFRRINKRLKVRKDFFGPVFNFSKINWSKSCKLSLFTFKGLHKSQVAISTKHYCAITVIFSWRSRAQHFFERPLNTKAFCR